jgi:hypothetical protein
MSNRECAGVLFESMVVGVCIGSPMVWALQIIVEFYK